MPTIDFLPDNKKFEVNPGETILQTASRNGIPHVNACGGEGKCTTCRLLILEGIDKEGSVISQFTLIADCKKGTRPSYSNALNPQEAKLLYTQFISTLQTKYPKIKTGEFQAHMKVSLTNDGPITIILDSKNK